MRIREVAAPQNLAEAITILTKNPDYIPWAGGTLLYNREEYTQTVSIIDLKKIKELTTINRLEHHIELGACVRLASILGLPETIPLEPLRSAVKITGTATIRNLATIGGNIAARSSFMTCFTALTCMDASIELRNADGVHRHSIHKLIAEDGSPYFPDKSLLTKIQIPIEPWDYAIIKRLNEIEKNEIFPISFAVAARLINRTISDLRIVAAGCKIFRDREFELFLVGKKLPIPVKDTNEWCENAYKKALTAKLDSNSAIRFARYIRSFLNAIQEDLI